MSSNVIVQLSVLQSLWRPVMYLGHLPSDSTCPRASSFDESVRRTCDHWTSSHAIWRIRREAAEWWYGRSPHLWHCSHPLLEFRIGTLEWNRFNCRKPRHLLLDNYLFGDFLLLLLSNRKHLAMQKVKGHDTKTYIYKLAAKERSKRRSRSYRRHSRRLKRRYRKRCRSWDRW